MVFVFASLFLTLLYAGLMATYRIGWRRTPEFRPAPGFEPQTPVTVLVPARNEAGRIEACLNAVLEGSWPHNLLEIIVVDDFSEDGTGARALTVLQGRGDALRSFEVVFLKEVLPSGAAFTANKKKALEIAIARASGKLIVATDADCLAGPNWLLYMVAAAVATDGERVVTAPVLFHREQGALQRFQALDFLGLMGITGAGIRLGFQRMGNGANLAYPKALFEAVGGYAGNETIASGDDLFLIQKFEKHRPGSVFFLKSREATVFTEAPVGWRAFVQQRIRWGTKNAALPEWPLRLALAMVLLFCCNIVANVFWALFEIFQGLILQKTSDYRPFGLLAAQLALKAASDFLFLNDLCRFFKRKELLRGFGVSFALHTVYIVWAGLGSLFSKKYRWKGREVQ